MHEFCRLHIEALERDEVRHNLLLAILAGLAKRPSPDVTPWSLGDAGACAIMQTRWPMVLGALDEAQCRTLAEQTAPFDYRGVVGSGRTVPWFMNRAADLGVVFGDVVPQRIHQLTDPPKYPGCPGTARLATSDDAERVADWVAAFGREAARHDPVPPRERLLAIAGEGRHMLWVVDGEAVSMAATARRTRNSASINAVYTPPALRGRGYAGSVTAAVAERIFAEGKSSACLYTDLRNPFSNRCYAKIGFVPVCEAFHAIRERPSP